MEVSAAVAAQDLELVVHGLDGVGGRKSTSNTIGVVEKEEVVRPLLPKLLDEGRGGFFESLAELLELSTADLGVPGVLDRAEPFGELGVVVLGEVSFSVSEPVDGTQLNIGVGKHSP